MSAERDPGPSPDQTRPPLEFRVVQRTYGSSSSPLVDVLLMLYDWSIERQLRVQAKVAMPPETDDVRPRAAPDSL